MLETLRKRFDARCAALASGLQHGAQLANARLLFRVR
jgi:hypothetical protein